MRDIHLFNIASTMSFGPSGSSINAMTTAVPKLVAGLTRGLFKGDLERHCELDATRPRRTLTCGAVRVAHAHRSQREQRYAWRSRIET